MFGSTVNLYYQGNIMSALGDEGGVAYTAEIIHDLRIFRGTVEAFDPAKGELTYRKVVANGEQKPLNTERIGSCRPIINLNQQKWHLHGRKGGKVRIYISNTYCTTNCNKDDTEKYQCKEFKPDSQDPLPFNKEKCDLLENKYHKSIIQGVIERVPDKDHDYPINDPRYKTDPDRWTEDVVGRYFAVNESSEYIDPGGENLPIAPEKRLYRWYRIVKLIPELQLLFVEVVRWGVEIGAPHLVDLYNYFNNSKLDNNKYVRKELKYIIAPGAVVSDVSKGVNENDNNFGERKLILQPNGDFKENSQYKFEPGDEIEQAIGPSPWNPSGFRVRHFNNFPSLKEDASFVSENRGTSPVRYGLSFGGGSGIFTTDLDNQYRRGGVAYKTGIMFLAVMEEGIRFKGEIKPYDSNSQFLGVGTPDAGLAIVLEQTPKKKVIGWTTKNDKIYATIGFDPDKENYYLRGAKAIEVENASLNFVRGLSATEKSANNLCEVNVPVEANSKNITITFKTPEIDPEYGIQITPSWLTVCAVTDKTETGFKILFEKSPSADGRENGKIDWFLAR
jgi:hypothetical protein